MNKSSSDDIINLIVLVTYILAGIGLFIGVLSLWMGFLSSNSTPLVGVDQIDDPLPDFTGFFRFIGISFIGTALFSLIGSFLFSKTNIIGWIMLIFVYVTGTLVSGYILAFSLSRFFPLALMSPMLLIYILLFLVGLYILYNLILNGSIRNRFIVIRKPNSEY